MDFDIARFNEIANEAIQTWISPRLDSKPIIINWGIDRGRRRAGFCRRPKETLDSIIVSISLSRHFVAVNEEEGVKEVIYHELAHVVHFNHGYEFKHLLTLMLGYSAGRYITEKVKRVQEGGYLYRCPNGHEHRYFRRLGREHSCGVCRRNAGLPYGFYRDFLLRPVDASVLPPSGRLYQCPNGHEIRKFRRFTVPKSCARCSPVFDNRFLFTEVQELTRGSEPLEEESFITRGSELLESNPYMFRRRLTRLTV